MIKLDLLLELVMYFLFKSIKKNCSSSSGGTIFEVQNI